MALKLSINTQIIGNISRLSKTRLLELQDLLEDFETINKEQLIEIGKEILPNITDEMEKQNIERILYMVENNKTGKLQEVQNVFLAHVEKALQGKKEGGRRKTRRSKSRKSRKSHKGRKSRKSRT